MVTKLNRARKNLRTGFTLIELLVVVLILGILLAVAIPLYLSSVKNSAKQTVKSNMKIIAQAGQAYKVKHESYTADKDKLAGSGVDFDLQSWPTGPRSVTYDLKKDGSDLIITAKEHGEDVFGTSGTDDEGEYSLSAGKYTKIDEETATAP